jgi:hypothetical protein
MFLEMPDGRLLSPQMTPKLSDDTDKMMMYLLFSPCEYADEDVRGRTTIDKGAAKAIIKAWIDNYDTEGFDRDYVNEARQFVTDRLKDAKGVCLLPAAEVPDMIKMAEYDDAVREQVEHEYGSLEARKQMMNKALSPAAQHYAIAVIHRK